MTGPEPMAIIRADDVTAACAHDHAIIYKHSPVCGASRSAAMEVRRFMEARPDVPVYRVDVVEDRPLSNELARRLEVRHESPQLILVRQGVAVWDTSHGGVRAASLIRALDERGL
jgi:bacillithiol system protein YtxJ